MENLLNCKGREFQATIDGETVEGKIQVEGEKVYLCQNKLNGSPCDDKLGYDYSWGVGIGSEFGLSDNNVTDFKLIDMDPETYKDWQVGDKIYCVDDYEIDDPEIQIFEIIFRSGELVVYKNPGDTASSNYTCNELFDNGCRLYIKPEKSEEIVEMTLEEVAKLKGIDVKNLRIKE